MKKNPIWKQRLKKYWKEPVFLAEDMLIALFVGTSFLLPLVLVAHLLDWSAWWMAVVAYGTAFSILFFITLADLVLYRPGAER